MQPRITMKSTPLGLILLVVLISFLVIANGERSNSKVYNSVPLVSVSIRRILHQPLFPVPDTSLSPPQDNDLSSQLPPAPPVDSYPDQPFFPEVPTGSNPAQPPPSPLPGPSTNGSVSFPTPAKSTKPTKKVAVAISVVIVTLGMLSALTFYIYKHRKNHPIETHKLVGGGNYESRLPSSNFLYIGTVEPENQRSSITRNDDSVPNSSPYQKLNSEKRSNRYRPSPDLQPLPPLSKVLPITNLPHNSPTATISSSDEESRDRVAHNPLENTLSCGMVRENHRGHAFPHSKRTSRSRHLALESPDVIKHAIIPSIKVTSSPTLSLPSPTIEDQTQDKQESRSNLPKRAKSTAPPPPPNLAILRALNYSPVHQKSKQTPPPPPPPPPPRLSTPNKVFDNIANKPSKPSQGPTKMVKSTEEYDGCSSSGRPNADDMEEIRPKLKPLHWDKVKASSDRVTVWDQLKANSFQINEDMMESLFGCEPNTTVKKETSTRKSILPPVEKEIRVLDPKKSQNIAILLRALNVTQEEVSEALLEGNPEGLGAELFETLVKMAPTKEEEIKLKDYNGDILKLGSAERFLKGILDIPFAFKRVEAMLYRANFDAEVNYLRKSYETLEIASEELKSSRLFLKLLEAVLQTGNRMNVGTNRGEAKAFKLDTLLKLADIKGTDGKTTLLHFVVQEISRSESTSSDMTAENQNNQIRTSKEEFKKQGFYIVSRLSKELGSLKNAAGMDFDVLSNYVSKLDMGLEKVRLVLQYEKLDMEGKFVDSMKKFLREAEEEIARVKAHERKALNQVREVTEYFHGDTAKEEAHPLRIFLIVRDFLSILDKVCKEVGTIDDRTLMGTARSFRISAYESQPDFTRHNVRRDDR